MSQITPDQQNTYLLAFEKRIAAYGTKLGALTDDAKKLALTDMQAKLAKARTEARLAAYAEKVASWNTLLSDADQLLNET